MRKRILSLTLVLLLLIQSVAPSFAQGTPVYDPLAMLDMLNEQAVAPAINMPSSDVNVNMPDLPNGSVSPQASDRPSELITGPNSTSRYASVVNPATGKLIIESKDINIDALGYDLALTRFNTENGGIYGSTFDYNFYTELKMYAGYGIGEVRIDGTKRAFEFVKGGDDGYITSYDDDPFINYELNEGHYKFAAEDQLVRKSKIEYIVTTENGEKLTYYGYKAPWRDYTGRSETDLDYEELEGVVVGDIKEGKLIKREDVYGNIVTYEYDSSGRLEAMVSGTQRLGISYANGNISKLEGPSGEVVDYNYTDGKLTSVTTKNGEMVSYGYTGNKITSISQKGFTQEFSYTGDKITQVTANEKVLYTYSYVGNTTTVTDANGGVEEFTYDEEENLVGHVDSAGNVFSYGYEDGMLTSKTSKAGTVTNEYYDDGTLKKTEDIFGNETTFTYYDNLYDSLKSQTSKYGTTTYEVDDYGKTLTETFASTEVDDNDEPVETYVNSFIYNSEGLIYEVTNKDSKITTFLYDENGYLESKDFEGRKTKYVYDLSGRLEKEISPEGVVVEFVYDDLGNTTLITTKGREIEYIGTDGLEVTEILPDKVSSFSYDLKGRVEFTRVDGSLKTYNYIDNKFADSTTVYGETAEQSETTSYIRDDLGQLISFTNDSGTTEYQYDSAGRVEKVTKGDYVIDYDYYDNSFVVTTPEGEMTTEFDNLGRTTKVIDHRGRVITVNAFLVCPCLARRLCQNLLVYNADSM